MAFTTMAYMQSSTMYTNSATSPNSDVCTSNYTVDSVKTSDSGSRKRKNSYQAGSDYDDDTEDDRSVRTNDDQKKQNHSEIEKRRRDKMNTYITELSAMVPMCHAMPRKLDKLTVLRMAVQHMKTIRGAVHSYTEGHYKPAFLSDQELKMLILQAADGFLFVVGCNRGRILYVSESVSQILNYGMDDLMGQSWFDILHPKDVAKVKEQLSASDLSPRERLIDAKTMLPVKTDVPCGATRLCPGARRSFFCRMKCKVPNNELKDEPDTQPGVHRHKKQQDRKYLVIQCTGYLKSWAPAKIGVGEQETDNDGDSSNILCLVAVGRVQPPIYSVSIQKDCMNIPNLRTMQFISRHAMDGKFLFVDQRSTLVLGFLPQELLGTSMYEYYHPEDIQTLAETHKLSLLSSTIVKTAPYRLKTKDGSFVHLLSEWKSFRNPWTKEVEYLIAKNSVIPPPELDQSPPLICQQSTTNVQNNETPTTFDFNQYTQNNEPEMQTFISTHVESSKIGYQVAEEVLEHQRRSDISSGSGLDSDANLFKNDDIPIETMLPVTLPPPIESIPVVEEPTPSTSSLTDALPNFSEIYNTPPVVPPDVIEPVPDNMMDIIRTPPIEDQSNNIENNDGNDEAAMAVIMSLLEADAGLGGPVDFSVLPWSLP